MCWDLSKHLTSQSVSVAGTFLWHSWIYESRRSQRQLEMWLWQSSQKKVIPSRAAIITLSAHTCTEVLRGLVMEMEVPKRRWWRCSAQGYERWDILTVGWEGRKCGHYRTQIPQCGVHLPSSITASCMHRFPWIQTDITAALDFGAVPFRLNTYQQALSAQAQRGVNKQPGSE